MKGELHVEFASFVTANTRLCRLQVIKSNINNSRYITCKFARDETLTLSSLYFHCDAHSSVNTQTSRVVYYMDLVTISHFIPEEPEDRRRRKCIRTRRTRCVADSVLQSSASLTRRRASNCPCKFQF